MAIGKYQLVATVKPSGDGVNRNVTWSSSDESVATVDENGLVTYIKPGYCTIVCKTEDGAFIATCNFIISIPVPTASTRPLESTIHTLVLDDSQLTVLFVAVIGRTSAVILNVCPIDIISSL